MPSPIFTAVRMAPPDFARRWRRTVRDSPPARHPLLGGSREGPSGEPLYSRRDLQDRRETPKSSACSRRRLKSGEASALPSRA